MALRATVRCYVHSVRRYVSKLSKFDVTGTPHSHQTSVLKSNYANSSNVSTFWYRLQLWIVTVFVQKTRDLLLKFRNQSFKNHSIHNCNIPSREHQPWYIILVMFPVLNIISRVYVYRPSVLLLIASGLPMVALIGVFLAISAAGWRAGGDTSLIFSSRIPSRLCRSPNTFVDEELYPVALTITLFFQRNEKTSKWFRKTWL